MPADEGSSGGGGGAESGGEEHPSEYRSAEEVCTGYIAGNTFHAKAVQYTVVDGMALFEGDIVLGTAEEVEQESERIKAELRGELAAGVVITGEQFRWPNCTVPYDIDPALPNQARVTDAIAHWEANTNYSFVLRTPANAGSHPDWVTFRASGGCSSAVGRRGGQQFVNLGPGCSTGNNIHEIGHVVGMWHEQSREDRDAFVTINWANIQPGREHNFNQHIADGDDVGPYDYGSIMHYPRTAFSVDGVSETITPTDPAAQIGQRVALSPGDIATANSLCPPKLRIETIKEITKEVAGEEIKWRFPETIKERIPEPPVTIKERIPEPPVTWVETVQPAGRIGRVVNPAITTQPTTQPFAMRTPHRAMGPQVAGDAAAVDALLAQLEAVAQALAASEAGQAALAQEYDRLVAALNALGVQ